MARTKKAPEHPKLSVHQVVAYNFRRARESLGWTQAETGERLAPYLGLRLNQAGVSAIEKTYDSDRRRNIDVAEVVAFARCFERPIGWFFLPPPGHSTDWIEPITELPEPRMAAADLVAHAIGTPPGSDSFAARIGELLGSADRDPIENALRLAFTGVPGSNRTKQIDLRRQALLSATLVRLASPDEQVITKMAGLLVQLVKLTPIGFDQLRRANPDEALRLLAEGDELVQPALRSRRADDEPTTFPSADGLDDLEPIDVAHAFDSGPPDG